MTATRIARTSTAVIRNPKVWATIFDIMKEVRDTGLDIIQAAVPWSFSPMMVPWMVTTSRCSRPPLLWEGRSDRLKQVLFSGHLTLVRRHNERDAVDEADPDQ
jgi:hypothetical protein